MIKVLVVDDIATVRELLTRILESDPELKVVATAANGLEAIEAVKRLRPDVATMDLQMPRMNGIDATRIIMETSPLPIVVVSANLDPRESSTTFKAIEAGALAVVSTPAGIGHPDHERSAQELITTVKIMSEVRVVRRWSRPAKVEMPEPTAAAGEVKGKVDVVAIGASTGGPSVIQHILAELQRDFPLPILIVQHIASGFTAGFTEWLAQSSAIAVKLAVHGELLHPGCAYVAPDGFNMGVGRDGRILLCTNDGKSAHCPSVSHLFRSVAEVYDGRVVAVLLTGMGMDGAAELKMLRDKGAETIAQDAESSLVYGMPGAAERIGAVERTLSPQQIIERLRRLAAAREKMR